MLQIDAGAAARGARLLHVVHQVTGDLQPLILTRAQRRVLEAIQDNERVIVLKGRQVYISTVCVLYALLFAIANPSVKVALVADISEKAQGLLSKATAWAQALGIPLRKANTEKLVLWNGAELHALTANSTDAGSDEVKAGRSHSYGFILLSEFAYYNRDSALLASLTRSALKGARIVIESTATPAENAFRSIWERGKGWAKIFIGFEEHDAYQLDEQAIDEAAWKEMRERYGFASRTHAAYWRRMVDTDLDGDIHRGLREAPIKWEDAFAFAEGRWIFRCAATEPTSVDLAGRLTFAEKENIPGGWRFYDEPDDSGVILGVDTGGGVGADASAIAIIGRRKGNLLATFVARNCIVPSFIAVAKAAAEKWKPAGTNVEGNGIGKAMYQALSLLPVARTQEHTSEDAEKPIRMNLVKLAIESGQVVAGPELEYEIKHSVMERPKRNRGAPVWDGPDDLLNAIGFALVWRREHPWSEQGRKINPRTHVDRASYRAKKHGKKVF